MHYFRRPHGVIAARAWSAVYGKRLWCRDKWELIIVLFVLRKVASGTRSLLTLIHVFVVFIFFYLSYLLILWILFTLWSFLYCFVKGLRVSRTWVRHTDGFAERRHRLGGKSIGYQFISVLMHFAHSFEVLELFFKEWNLVVFGFLPMDVLSSLTDPFGLHAFHAERNVGHISRVLEDHQRLGFEMQQREWLHFRFYI